MSPTIRDDVFGVVAVDGLHLKAGDEVPDGVHVGAHLIVPDALDPEPEADTVTVPAPEAEAEAPADKPTTRARSGRAKK